MNTKQFQNLILKWFDQFGRKNLPWQHDKTPYRVWVSEIMLQQTQVSTVIPYFLKFMQHFPSVQSLANANEDEVLHLWTGLGYYNRARNLHRAAKMITEKFSGHLPSDLAMLEVLPGVGRSTAGAISSLAFEMPAPILDGNVKRVLARFHGVTTWPGEKNTVEALWKIAEKYTPKQRVADYTQAMMDLGATVCTRSQPNCTACPLMKQCAAYAKNLQNVLPISKPQKSLPIYKKTFLILQHQKKILLEKRPATGVWAKLWSMPEITGESTKTAITAYCKKQFKLLSTQIKLGPIFRHTFSHFHLDILPAYVKVHSLPRKIMENDQHIWYDTAQPQSIGLPQPVKKLISELL